ncbi:hypothetical protein [Glycomyces sp. NPDC047010]|uniref:hypothetical protein n=1 Tax=Glycomyces sp. NPDC047010 TaxID=3155023 RepID=UPI0033E8B88E
MDETTVTASDLDLSPGLVIGIILMLAAIGSFSPAFRGWLDYRLFKLTRSLLIIGALYLVARAYASS